ncbi:MAG: prefoldin subunit alpha [Candidatus Saliniplasma sp.]
MVNQQEFRQKVNRLQQLNSQVEAFQDQLDFIDNMIEGHNEAKKTMENYSKKESGSQLLVPIGANSYLLSKVGENDKVLIGLGADVSAEKEVGEAKEIVEKRKKEFKDTKDDLMEDFEEMKQQAQQLEQEVRQEYQELQSQGQV